MNNKQFGKTIKPLFSNQTKAQEKITLAQADKVFTHDAKNAGILSIFFSNPVKNLQIPEFEEVNPFAKKRKNILSDIESNFQI